MVLFWWHEEWGVGRSSGGLKGGGETVVVRWGGVWDGGGGVIGEIGFGVGGSGGWVLGFTGLGVVGFWVAMVVDWWSWLGGGGGW